MNMIEIYDESGKVSNVINGDRIICAYPIKKNKKDCVVQIECVNRDYIFRSYETIENFLNRTGEQWIELEKWGEKIKVKKSEIAAYSHGKSEGKDCVTLRIKGSDSSIVCDESIESFEAKLGINKEDAK